MLNADELIKLLDLKPLPVEGGYFRQTYKSLKKILPDSLPEGYETERALSTCIYYLLTSDRDSFSAIHKLPTEEIWHFYLGNPVEMLLLGSGKECRKIILGQDILSGEHVQFVVPAGVWQGAKVVEGGRFALLGTTMSPGFEPDDYTEGSREELVKKYPEYSELITRLTREE